MNKAIVAIVVIVVLAIIGWVAFGNKNNSNSSTTNSNNSSNAAQTNSSAQTQSPVVSNAVTIQNFAFSPANITVIKGTKVTWTNQDSTAHTVTENDGQNGPSAPPLGQNQTYSFTFNQTGTFHYHCSIHPEMTGTVTVTVASTTTPSNSSNNPTNNSSNSNSGNPY